jgi:hypothetical protein
MVRELAICTVPTGRYSVVDFNLIRHWVVYAAGGHMAFSTETAFSIEDSFSTGLNGDGFVDWAEWGWLIQRLINDKSSVLSLLCQRPLLFLTFKSIFSSRRRQRRRQQHHHLSTMWCVSKLDFMIISLRATLKWNKKNSSKRVHLLCDCTFQIFVLTWL